MDHVFFAMNLAWEFAGLYQYRTLESANFWIRKMI